MGTIRPMRERLLVRKDPGLDRVGSLWLPEMAKKRQTVGTIVATGPGYFLGSSPDGTPLYGPLEYRVGDRVVFGEWAGIELSVNGEPLWLLMPDEIHALIEDPEVADVPSA